MNDLVGGTKKMPDLKPCRFCWGQGWYEDPYLDCCGGFLPSGECCGNEVVVVGQVQCHECGGSGEVVEQIFELIVPEVKA